jgi:sporulation protein YlmC with PRC-barrel domain
MLRNLKNLEQYKVRAIDGDLGSVVDFLFDDERWTVRHLVVATGGLFARREVLLSPIALQRVDDDPKLVHVALTREQIKNSPSIDLDRPVSRQHERDYYDYYGYPYYWGYGGLWGMGYYPGGLAMVGASPYAYPSAPPRGRPGEPDEDVHLRSAKEVAGYHVEGTDGSIGHVQNFIVDDESWMIRYLVVDTSNWWMGKSVLIAPEWTTRISWSDKRVFLEMARATIKESPEWQPGESISRAYEERLSGHYGRPPMRRRGDRRVKDDAGHQGRSSLPR